MKLSFGMIFSIILIIIFISFAFYAIQKFIGIQKSIQVGQFMDNLQDDVDNIWKGSGSISKSDGYILPKKIEYACFVDYSSDEKGTNREFYQKLKQVYFGDENLIFYPVGSGDGLDSKEIKHIDIARITQDENPFCIENVDGKIRLTIERDYKDELVVIER